MLLLILVWPLLLALAVAVKASRNLALKVVPWAALPALLAAGVLADTGLELPYAMLGSVLRLDDSGRLFLLLSAGLWLATGLLAYPQLHNAGASRFAVLLLLALAGVQGLALAGDALLFFTAGTVVAYALYGLLVHQADASALYAGRVLMVLLVISDLVVFEVLLLLGQAAGSVDFVSLRQAMAGTDSSGLMLGLLLIGFGAKAGIVGLHVWLAPALKTAVPAIRPALIGFMFGAGLLGWLRLLPLGQIHWGDAGMVLQGLAGVTMLYAVVAGGLQAHPRAVPGYIAMALTGLWLVMLGFALRYPQGWGGVVEVGPAALLQSAFALAALLVVPCPDGVTTRTGSRQLGWAVAWVAALLLVVTPLGFMMAVPGGDATTLLELSAAMAGMAFLVVRRLLLVTAATGEAQEWTASLAGQQSSPIIRILPLLVACGLTGAALLSVADTLRGLTLARLWLSGLLIVLAGGAAWLSTNRRAAGWPKLPVGDLLAPVSRGLAVSLSVGRDLGHRQMPRWRDAALTRLLCPWSGVNWGGVIDRWQARISPWSTALVLLLLLGLIVAGLVAQA